MTRDRLASIKATSDTHRRENQLEAVSLPFTVKCVRTEEHLLKAIDIRAETYKRHHPILGKSLKEAEPADRAQFSLVLLAESKQDKQALGTIRIETNLAAPLYAETLLSKDSKLKGRTIALVTRLGVLNTEHAQLVKLTLFKALHRYCLACQIDWIFVTAKPPMDRQYLRLGFEDLSTDSSLVPIPWSKNISARLLGLETITAESKWRAESHPLYKFMILDYCPDIEIFSSVSGIWTRPRARRQSLPSEELLRDIFGTAVI
jgi:hypothetical protein